MSNTWRQIQNMHTSLQQMSQMPGHVFQYMWPVCKCCISGNYFWLPFLQIALTSLSSVCQSQFFHFLARFCFPVSQLVAWSVWSGPSSFRWGLAALGTMFFHVFSFASCWSIAIIAIYRYLSLSISIACSFAFNGTLEHLWLVLAERRYRHRYSALMLHEQ